MNTNENKNAPADANKPADEKNKTSTPGTPANVPAADPKKAE